MTPSRRHQGRCRAPGGGDPPAPAGPRRVRSPRWAPSALVLRKAVVALVAAASAACGDGCPPGTTLFKGRDRLVGRYVEVCARNGSIGRHGAYREYFDTAGKHLARRGNHREDIAFGLFHSYDAKGRLSGVECYDLQGKKVWRDDRPKGDGGVARACP